MTQTSADQLQQSGEAADQQSATMAADGVALPCPLKSSWIELALIGADGKGIADERYRLLLPDGSERTGKTDASGIARIEGIPQGTCKASFPDLDMEALEKV